MKPFLVNVVIDNDRQSPGAGSVNDPLFRATKIYVDNSTNLLGKGTYP
jgi:hypothetical protein